MVEQGIWRIRTNQEFKELYRDLDIVADIEKIGKVKAHSKNGLWNGR